MMANGRKFLWYRLCFFVSFFFFFSITCFDYVQYRQHEESGNGRIMECFLGLSFVGRLTPTLALDFPLSKNFKEVEIYDYFCTV